MWSGQLNVLPTQFQAHLCVLQVSRIVATTVLSLYRLGAHLVKFKIIFFSGFSIKIEGNRDKRPLTLSRCEDELQIRIELIFCDKVLYFALSEYL